VHDREQPAAEIAAPPQMEAAPRPFQTVLDEIVRLRAIAEQRQGIAAQMRDLVGDATADVVDGARPPGGLRLRPPGDRRGC